MRILRGTGGEYDLDEFLARPLLAVVSTSSPAGARASAAWFLWEEGAIWTIVEEGRNTLQDRVMTDGRVSAAVVDFRPREGLLQHVSIRGLASVEPFDDARGSRLLTRYYRFLDGYSAALNDETGKVRGSRPMRFVRLVPESVLLRGWSYSGWVATTKIGAAEAGRSPNVDPRGGF